MLWINIKLGTAFASRENTLRSVSVILVAVALLWSGFFATTDYKYNRCVDTFESEIKKNLGDPNGEEGCQGK